MERYQANLSYDGTEFYGFADQRGFRTVQGVFESALQALEWGGRRILAGGRTDAGVHASGQVVAFDLEWRHGVNALQAAINARLPKDVSVLQLASTRSTFHPRYDAMRRRYRYRIFESAWTDPLEERYAMRVRRKPDIEVMQEAASSMLGSHDFCAFGTAPRKGSHTKRTVFRAEWKAQAQNQMEFWMEADAFLYRMVRITVGTLLQVGNGKRSIESFRRLLVQPVQGKAGPSVPPCGLCLMQILYPATSELGSAESF
jgi:tRNA pseudouridine38-40 synthase